MIDTVTAVERSPLHRTDKAWISADHLDCDYDLVNACPAVRSRIWPKGTDTNAYEIAVPSHEPLMEHRQGLSEPTAPACAETCTDLSGQPERLQRSLDCYAPLLIRPNSRQWHIVIDSARLVLFSSGQLLAVDWWNWQPAKQPHRGLKLHRETPVGTR